MIRTFSFVFLCALLCGGCIHRNYAYQSPYRHAFVSPGMKFLGLPVAVQNAIRAQAGAAEILDIARYEMHDWTYYKVWFFREGSYPPLYIAQDGSVLNSDLTVSMRPPTETFQELAGHKFGTVSMADLPAEVVKTIKTQAPTFEIQRIEQTGDAFDRVYLIQFRGTNAPAAIRVHSSGKILE
jgi:hypothetical protein